MQLPQHAQRKLRDLQMSVEDGHARANLMLRRVKEQHETVERLRHDAVTAPDQRFESEIADAETELVRMQNLQQSRFEQFQATQSLLTNLREWIRQTPDDMPFVPVPKRMLGVDDPQAHVAQLRQAIEQKKSELFRIATASASRDAAREQARGLVDQLARLGAPTIRSDRGRLHVFGWNDSGLPQGPLTRPEMLSLLAWLDRDRVLAALEREIETKLPDGNALPFEEREQRIHELEAEILAIEREEENVIENSPISISRRADASPQAVLGIALLGSELMEAAE